MSGRNFRGWELNVGAALRRDGLFVSRHIAAPTVALVLSSLLLGATSARASEITLPEEKARLAESPLPGYALASALCYTCHSVDYIRYQPPASPRAYWKTQVVKMQKTFGAPIPDSALEPIIDYLVKTYGAERGAAVVGGVTPESPKH